MGRMSLGRDGRRNSLSINPTRSAALTYRTSSLGERASYFGSEHARFSVTKRSAAFGVAPNVRVRTGPPTMSRTCPLRRRTEW